MHPLLLKPVFSHSQELWLVVYAKLMVLPLPSAACSPVVFPSLSSMRLTSPSCLRGRCSSRCGTTIALAATRSWGRWRSHWTPGTSRATWRSSYPCMARCAPATPALLPTASLACCCWGIALNGQSGVETLAEHCQKACAKSNIWRCENPSGDSSAVVVKKGRSSAVSLASLLRVR